MNNTLKVSISIDETANLIHKTVVDSITGVLLDKYEIITSGNKQCIVMVFDKYYSRVGNRLTLTVTIDNFEDYTRVHYISGGGGRGLFTFDWGASDSFSNIVPVILKKYII